GDHEQAGREGAARAQPDGLVAVAEVVAPFRMPDERAHDAELEQHRRRDLTRVRALVVPVDVLRVGREADLDAVAEPCERRADDRVEPGELGGIGPAKHLPVAGDEHSAILWLEASAAKPPTPGRRPTTHQRSSRADGMAATPGSSLPSSSSRLAPPPVETQ